MHLYLNKKLQIAIIKIVLLLFTSFLYFSLFPEILFVFPTYIGIFILTGLSIQNIKKAFIITVLPNLILIIGALLYYLILNYIDLNFLKTDYFLSHCILILFVIIYSVFIKFRFLDILLLLILPILQFGLYKLYLLFKTSPRPKFTTEINLPILYALLGILLSVL